MWPDIVGWFDLDWWSLQSHDLFSGSPLDTDSDFYDVGRAQSYSVSLPAGYTCDHCFIQLLRQATEWGGGYRFWSCADVTIVDCKHLSSMEWTLAPSAKVHPILLISHLANTRP